MNTNLELGFWEVFTLTLSISAILGRWIFEPQKQLRRRLRRLVLKVTRRPTLSLKELLEVDDSNPLVLESYFIDFRYVNLSKRVNLALFFSAWLILVFLFVGLLGESQRVFLAIVGMDLALFMSAMFLGHRTKRIKASIEDIREDRSDKA